LASGPFPVRATKSIWGSWKKGEIARQRKCSADSSLSMQGKRSNLHILSQLHVLAQK